MSIGSLSTIVSDKYNGNYGDWLKDFVARVKKEYPNDTHLHQLLEQNKEFAGRYLNDMSNTKKRAALYTEWYYTYQRNGLQR